MHDLVNQNRRNSVRTLLDKSGINRTTVHQMLCKDLSFTKISAKFVPHVLTDQMKKTRKEFCELNLASFERDPSMLDKIVSGDESWVPLYDPESKHESCQWIAKGDLWPKKALRSRSVKKTMLTAFFDADGVILTHFLPQGETVDTDQYCLVLKTLKERLRKK